MAAPTLTDREAEVLRTISAEALTIPQAAQRLGIADNTVRAYLGRIRAKYADVGRPAPTRAELRNRALEDGYITELPTHRPID